MPEIERNITGYLLIFVSGLALIFLSHTTGIELMYPTISKAIEAIGFGLVGYAPIELLTLVPARLREHKIKRDIDRSFQSAVKIVSSKKELPIFIAVDAEGCLTPPHRTEIDLRNFQRLRGYCEFVKTNDGQQFPPLVIYTGRSQGYVELLAQSLGMINTSFDLPFIIENGSALYFPGGRKTVPLITIEQQGIIESTHHLLTENLPNNEFEPKSYMISINTIPTRQTIDELREKVTLLLQANDILKSLTISSTYSAVDITLKNINKLSGLKEVLNVYHGLRHDQQDQGLEDIVALADSTSDLGVIKNVGTAYCPAHDVHPEVLAVIEKQFGSDHVVNERHIAFVIKAVERICGLHLL